MNAQAQMFYLEPQIRTGAGVAWIDGALGFSASMDTRMTHLIYVESRWIPQSGTAKDRNS